MTVVERYYETATAQLRACLDTQREAIEHAARVVADALAAERFLYAFGTGHSHLLAEEIFYRAGGLARAAAILDPPLMLHEGASASSQREQQSGYAEEMLSRYPIAAGDVLIIASNSGRNAVPIELAFAAQRLGLRSVAITSLAHSRAFPSRHPSGKRLFEIVEVVLDNQAVPGDAALDLPGLPRSIGPTSTLTGAFLINSVVVRAIEILWASGSEPEIYASNNAHTPGWNDALIAKYRSQLRHL